jgi:uncharacterized protein (DUF885 family)
MDDAARRSARVERWAGKSGPGEAVRMDDLEAGERRRLARLDSLLERWRSIERGALPEGLRTEYDIFGRLHEDRANELRFRAHLMPFTTFVPFYSQFPQRGDRKYASAESLERYLERLNGWHGRIRETIALMRTGLREGITIPRVTVVPVPDEIAVHIVDDPARSRLWAPFEARPSGMGDSAWSDVRDRARAAIDTSVVAGYRAFRDFLVEEYIPRTRSTIGISEITDGRAFYEHRVRQFTTLDISPEEVHQRGLAEVARIRLEMEGVMQETGWRGDFAGFLEELRTNPRFYADTPEELLMRSALVLKRMDGKLPELFHRLPRTPYGIRAIPEYAAPRMTTAYYSGAPRDGSRAGYYYINTHDLASRPLYEIQALSFHEAVPGHHLQRAIQLELQEVPEYRRGAGFTAYVEGWALYAERLGLEVGFYEDPYDDFGRLSYEMWRALRLVVDTGIHAFGWSRQRAIDFMAENSGLSLANITAEVDRYISWPGQALAYKMGEIVIRDLRAEAESRLGDAFDLRAFNDAVLATGPVPLAALETAVRRWMDEVEERTAPAPGG